MVYRTALLLLVFNCGVAVAGDGSPYLPPKSVSLKPLFLVPRGERAPSERTAKLLRRHLVWTQRRYRELLSKRSTFEIAEGAIDTVQARHPLSHYQKLKNGLDASAWMGELLANYGYTRYNCPHMFLIVVANPHSRYPLGGGRPLNGGINTGGGVIVISTYALTRMPNFQSTLQHEIGHAFGLPHVDVYGYDMNGNASMMSYNPRHKTHEFKPGSVPGILIPEDLRALSLNDRVFPKLDFRANRDVPDGYSLHPRIVTLGPMQIDDNPPYAPVVTTDAGEEVDSQISNIVAGQIGPSRGPGVTYNAKQMWHSATVTSGDARINIAFPFAVELSRLTIHSEHSGQYHRAIAGRLEVKSGAVWRRVASATFSKADAELRFAQTGGREWRLQLRPGATRKIVLRGLRFFRGDTEIFPQLVPRSAR